MSRSAYSGGPILLQEFRIAADGPLTPATTLIQ